MCKTDVVNYRLGEKGFRSYEGSRNEDIGVGDFDINKACDLVRLGRRTKFATSTTHYHLIFPWKLAPRIWYAEISNWKQGIEGKRTVNVRVVVSDVSKQIYWLSSCLNREFFIRRNRWRNCYRWKERGRKRGNYRYWSWRYEFQSYRKIDLWPLRARKT